MKRHWTKIRQHPHFPIIALILVSLVVGLFTLTDYGASWDEHLQYKQNARHALNTYGQWVKEGRAEGQWEGQDESTGVVKDFHGPAFVMTVELFTRFAQHVNPDWQETDLRHLLHFITYLIGVASLYFIARRWLGVWASFGATLLFVTQPVFWGHGFINPKDMPFAAMFTLSVAPGLRLHDYFFNGLLDSVASAWDSLPHRIKTTLKTAAVIWAASILILFAGVAHIQTGLSNLVLSAHAQPDSFMASVFSLLAEDFTSAPADVYVTKIFVLFLRLRGTFTLLSTLALLWLFRKRFPGGLRLLGSPLLWAGFAVGFATSMRIAGPLAGLLVAVYLFGRAGKKAILPVILYGAVGVTVMYLTWPYLWGGPVERLLDGLGAMSAFPWQGRTLFAGVYYPASEIPKAYLPTLLAWQLTEPVWVLFFAGLTVAGWSFARTRKYGGVLFLALGWFIIPFIGFVFGGISLYDNFRQVLFILPPVFLVIGVSFEWLFGRVRRTLWRALIIAVLVLPGIKAIERLHPYEYAYYNSFAGGTGGAFRRYETEYWGTSFREAADFLNTHGKANARIMAIGPGHTLSPFLREDFKMVDSDPDYVVMLTRYDFDLENYTQFPDWYRVERDGAVFAVIREVSTP
ncbi:MAG: hypothetical protein Kow002_05500 [Anaerolineales bacterium]